MHTHGWIFTEVLNNNRSGVAELHCYRLMLPHRPVGCILGTGVSRISIHPTSYLMANTAWTTNQSRSRVLPKYKLSDSQTLFWLNSRHGQSPFYCIRSPNTASKCQTNSSHNFKFLTLNNPTKNCKQNCHALKPKNINGRAAARLSIFFA